MHIVFVTTELAPLTPGGAGVVVDRLRDRLGERGDRVTVILVGEAERRLGLVVDRLLGEYELVVKPIEDPLVRSPGIAGASILGDGKVVLILNLRGLAEKKRRSGLRAEGLK